MAAARALPATPPAMQTSTDQQPQLQQQQSNDINRVNGLHSNEQQQARFDPHVVVVMAALMCVLLCALGINSAVRCAVRCNFTGRAFRRSRTDTDEERNIDHAASSKRGMRKSQLKGLPTTVYCSAATTQSTKGSVGGHEVDAAQQLAGPPDCAICLGDFADGDRIRLLPACQHGFHLACIDAWLSSHASCPTCRHSCLDKVARLPRLPNHVKPPVTPAQ